MEEFLQACDDIQTIVNKHPNIKVIVGGDVNIDFKRLMTYITNT